MPEIVTTPISYFEIEMHYAEPDLKMWLDRVNVVQAVWDALKPWNVAVDDVEIIQTGKPSEQGIKFKISQKLSSFFFGPAYCRFTRDSTDWGIAEETVHLVETVTHALLSQTKVTIASKKTTIVLHAQPKRVPFIKITGSLIPQKLAELEEETAKTMAIVVKWERRKMTIDGSANLANGIFLRFEREFEGTTTLTSIALQLKADESQVFSMLGIQEE